MSLRLRLYGSSVAARRPGGQPAQDPATAEQPVRSDRRGLFRLPGRCRRWPAPEVLIPLVVYLAAGIWFVQDRYSRSDFPLDDAWIHRVYARSLAMGHGFAYNAGQQETGSTSPLWAIVTAPAHWLEFAGTGGVVVAVKLIGWTLGAAAVVGVARLGELLAGSRLVAGIAGSLAACEPRLLFSAFSGMETTLLIALWVWMCVALLKRRYVLFLLLLGLTPVTRPESLVLVPLALIAIPDVVRAARSRRLKLAALLLPLAPQAIWMAACLSINGRPLPNTFYVKAGAFSLANAQLAVAWKGLTGQGLCSLWAWPAGMLAFVGLCLLRRSHAAWHGAAVLLLAPIVYLLGVVSTRTVLLEGYYWTRWLDPATVILAVPFCLGFACLAKVAPGLAERFGAARRAELDQVRPCGPRRGQTALRIAAITLAVVFAVVSFPQFRRTMYDRRSHLATDSRAISIMNVQMGRWLRENTPSDAVVGVHDAGAIRYFGDRRTVDLVGLNNSEIAGGRLSLWDAIEQCDWLAIFPGVYPPAVVEALQKKFVLRHVIRIPPEEYTICKSMAQTVKIAAERKTARRR